ncbi:lipopolysaccharide biosynthesis protein [Streptomyces sp. SAJ15]|nr:lipopolysaccharide biosynthesis protein [Streptomyces sp. SAJ15]
MPGWLILLLCTALGGAGGAAYGWLTPAQYSATGYVVVVPGMDSEPATALGFAQAYGRIGTGGAVLLQAQRLTGRPAAELRDKVRTSTSPDSPLIEITGTDSRPARAAAVANAVARALTRKANAASASTGVSVTGFAAALEPDAPSTPAPRVTTAVGGCAGAVLGCLALLVRPSRSGRRGERPTAGPAAPAGHEPSAGPEPFAALGVPAPAGEPAGGTR